MGRKTGVLAAALVATLLLGMAPGAVMPPHALVAAAPACSAGLVALTFDDGPAAVTTPRLVGILRDLRADATFFMVGSRVRTAPVAARLVARSGFVVANHSWSHPQLTTLSDARVAAELTSTRDELRRNGIVPSRLMRPPYGSINPRVREVIRYLGLAPVLWTVDSRDWEPNTVAQIADRILAGLRPGGLNIVLQHDGVRRSPTSVDAVPIVVREGRRRGYCFTVLGPNGRPKIPVPVARMSIRSGAERGRVPVLVTITLDRPTNRSVSLRLRTVDRTAVAGADYRARAFRVVFAAGQVRRTVVVPVFDDKRAEAEELFWVVLDRPWAMRIGGPLRFEGVQKARIVSDE